MLFNLPDIVVLEFNIREGESQMLQGRRGVSHGGDVWVCDSEGGRSTMGESPGQGVHDLSVGDPLAEYRQGRVVLLACTGWDLPPLGAVKGCRYLHAAQQQH